MNETLSEIKTENVVGTLEKYKEANPEKSLTALIYSQKGSEDEKRGALDSIQEKLINKSEQYKIDNSDLIKRYDEAMLDGELTPDKMEEIEAINSEYIARIKAAEELETQKQKFYCTICCVQFPTLEERNIHLKSDFHILYPFRLRFILIFKTV